MPVRSKVAALYVQEGGAYSNLQGVEPWTEERDARRYAGPYPVVAHPPCQLWVNLTGVNYKRWGGEHNRPGNDKGCFFHALRCVRRFGGVLEHPAGSYAWPTFGLDAPREEGWGRSGDREWICEVWQSAYGHKARKRTWLIYVGDRAPFELLWSRRAGTHQCGWFDRTKPTLSKREASATPILFRDALISLARHSRKRSLA